MGPCRPRGEWGGVRIYCKCNGKSLNVMGMCFNSCEEDSGALCESALEGPA